MNARARLSTCRTLLRMQNICAFAISSPTPQQSLANRNLDTFKLKHSTLK